MTRGTQPRPLRRRDRVVDWIRDSPFLTLVLPATLAGAAAIFAAAWVIDVVFRVAR